MQELTYLKLLPAKGLGLFSAIQFDKGQLVLANLIVKAPELPENHQMKDYLFWWNDDFEVFAEGRMAFINHSATPNCSLVRNYGWDRLELYALKTIEVDEELTFDYGIDCWFECEK